MTRAWVRYVAAGLMITGVLLLSGCQHSPPKPACDPFTSSDGASAQQCANQHAAYDAYQHQTLGQKLIRGDSKTWLSAGGMFLLVVIVAGFFVGQPERGPGETPEQRVQREHQEQAEALAQAQQQAALQEQLQREEEQRIALEAQQRAEADEKERQIQQEMDRVRREEL